MPRRWASAGNIGNRVDHALGVGRRRAHHHDGVVGARRLQDGGARRVVGLDRDPHQVDVEVVGRLGEGGMRALARHHLRPGDPALAPDVAGGLDRLEEAFGATRGEVALDLPAGRRIVGPEQAGRVGDDVVLHHTDAREGEDVEPVLRAVEGQGVGEQLVQVVAGRVHQAEDATAPPVLVVLLHGDEVLHHLGAGQAPLGHGCVGEDGGHGRVLSPPGCRAWSPPAARRWAARPARRRTSPGS